MLKIFILVIAVIMGICKFTSVPEKIFTTLTTKSNSDPRHDDLVASMIKLFESGAFSDFTFYVAGEKIPAHKAILAARSENFNDIFKTSELANMKELTIEEFSSEAVKATLRFMYAGEIGDYVFEHPAEVYKVACVFSLPFLQTVLQRILESMNSANAIQQLIWANKVKNAILEETVMDIIEKSGVYEEKLDDWVAFKQNHPTLANKVDMFISKKRHNSKD